ncbi:MULTISPECIES: NAD(P)/FAD-dependent oxidoreductase [Streptomycetaceae]|uniref:Monooxygenase FAD-binding protein n=1 Tax=Streptantibioticus cattleyicolor (strain ATCC 35852 / DSM 46488 / JCM 4925 / NBRC 14057 / NRRL 8057) TaxID=1003195 RepID=F8K3C0_STREN|nr:NAD(P)/FAD-dependent oxidoreductase [Streptantibioticus cattleyicolor]AEW95032.1 monooxygenase FAD-binding protein [Streptantibioticus cattleyicolor NRRL 8057 = DSM 46488]MYS59631.1 FAD-dependent oxidoreductase [Streptomyces sp. SID5468]CCB75384.1 putative hydroxylase [Streptantibioticus cattleyicolor NRRL 8057 = DSM 46488]
MYDVIVVGARCAGAPTAMLFARAGYRVLMVDRAEFPRDTLSTLYIHQPGVALLNRWGLLEQVTATGCPPIDKVVYRVEDLVMSGCSLPADGIRSAYAPRRFLLDAILADAAVAAGVEFRQGCAVDSVLVEDEQVVGVGYRTADGRHHEERARLVVGADGMRSRFASLVGAATVTEHPVMTCAYYAYWDPFVDHFDLREGRGQWVGALPTNDATLVAAYFPQSEFERVRRDALGAYLEALRTSAPDLYAHIEGREPLERLRGTGDQRNFFREPAGLGWALVGDAGHHKDSITARGITDAFRQAQLLADCLTGKDLADPDELIDGLEEYAALRDESMIDAYYSTLSVAELNLPGHRLDALRAIAADQGDMDRYFSTLAGVLSVDEFHTPELLARMEAV